MKRSYSKGNSSWVRIVSVIVLMLMFGLFVFLSWNRRAVQRAPYRILFVPKVIDEENDFWKALIEGTEQGAKEYGVELVIEAADAENNHEMQSEILRRAAADPPDAVILAPTSYTKITAAAKEVKNAGIPLILVDSTMDEKVADAVIATDNFTAGKRMAECLENSLPENPVIGVIAHVQGSSTAIEREAGLREGLGEYENCIVGTVFSNSDYQQGYDVTIRLLQEHPDINVLVGLNEYSAVGAARAVKDRGLNGKIRMVGFDSSIEEIQLLESGVFEGIVVQKPFNMGYFGVETAVQAIQGKSVPSYIDSGSQAVTKEEMYSEENQKLLFLFRENIN